MTCITSPVVLDLVIDGLGLGLLLAIFMVATGMLFSALNAFERNSAANSLALLRGELVQIGGRRFAADSCVCFVRTSGAKSSNDLKASAVRQQERSSWRAKTLRRMSSSSKHSLLSFFGVRERVAPVVVAVDAGYVVLRK